MSNESYYNGNPDDQNRSVSNTMTVAIVIEDLVMIFGILGNAALFALMRRHKFSQHTFAVYFSFSAIFDSWYLFSNALLDSFETFRYEYLDSIAAKYSSCVLFYMLESFSEIACPWLVCLLTVDRFISICYPDFGRRYSTKAKAITVCILATLASIIINVPYSLYEKTHTTVNVNGTEQFRCKPHLPHQEAGEFIYFLLIYVIPLFIILILSGRMLCVLRRTSGYAFISEEGLSLMNEKARLERLNGIVLYVLVISFLTWLPFCLVEMIAVPYETFSTVSTGFSDTLDKAWHATLLIYMVAYAQNFYILMLMSRMFRTEFVKMMRSISFRSSSQDPDPGPAEEVVLSEYSAPSPQRTEETRSIT